MEATIYDKPFKAPVTNNRKKTLCRIKDDLRHNVQSVPVFDTPKGTIGRKQIGFRYIQHK